MAFRYYAVRVGRKTGIYDKHQSAQSNVHGISGGEMKGFYDREKAQAWINEIAEKPTHRDLTDLNVVAYTDGSYNRKTGAYGSGVVITRHNKIIAEMAVMGMDEEFQKSTHAPGELFAVLMAIQWAIDHGCNEVEICHDFSTASKLAMGLCRATAPVSREYNRRYIELAEVIGDDAISFRKIKAHSGNPGNARADQLARYACGK